MSYLSKQLQKLRKNRNILQKDISSAIGCSVQAYSNYESGKRSPDFSTLKKIADYYEVTVDFLLGERKNTVDKINETVKALVPGVDLVFYDEKKSISDQDLERLIEIAKIFIKNDD